MIDLPTTLHAAPPPRMPTFDVPAGVTVIDLAGDPAEAAELLATQARAVLPGITDEQVAHVVAARQLIAERLRAGGVYWAGSCIARSDVDPSRLTVAHLTASVLDLEVDAVVADMPVVAARLRNDDGTRVAEVVELPVGPAVVVIDEQVVRPATTVVGSPDGTGHRVRQVQVVVPLPDAPGLVALTLATEYLADWDAYLDLMAVIARSLVFVA